MIQIQSQSLYCPSRFYPTQRTSSYPHSLWDGTIRQLLLEPTLRLYSCLTCKISGASGNVDLTFHYNFSGDYVGMNFEMLEELRQSFSAGSWFRGWLYLGLIVGYGSQTETDKFGSMPQSK
jgi:hypothetical protein